MSTKFLKNLIKKHSFISFFFIGLVFSSMIFDIINTSDDRGYQKEVSICCFLLEYLIPRRRT